MAGRGSGVNPPTVDTQPGLIVLLVNKIHATSPSPVGVLRQLLPRTKSDNYDPRWPCPW